MGSWGSRCCLWPVGGWGEITAAGSRALWGPGHSIGTLICRMMPLLWWTGADLGSAVGSGGLKEVSLLVGGAVSMCSWLFGLRHLSTGTHRLVCRVGSLQ